LSTSERSRTDFEAWLTKEFAATGEFTALVVLVSINGTQVLPLCSTYFNVVGADIDWGEITVLFAGSGHVWQGASFFPVTAEDGGAVDNPTARRRLRDLEARIDEDRLVLNEGHFFDQWGRKLQIEEVPLQ